MSSCESIHLPRTFDVNDIPKYVKVSPIQINDRGGKSAKIKFKGEKWFFQFPRMKFPFGISNKYGLTTNASFDGYQSGNAKIKATFDLIESMQNHLVKVASDNSYTWIEQAEASESICKAFLRPTIRYSRDKVTKKINTQYAPTMSMAFREYNGDLRTKVFLNSKDTKITTTEDLLSKVQGRFEGSCIVCCEKVTFNGPKFGYKFFIEQIKIQEKKNIMATYAFRDDGDEAVDVEYTLPEHIRNPDSVSSSASTVTLNVSPVESAPDTVSMTQSIPSTQPSNYVSSSESDGDDLENSASDSESDSEDEPVVVAPPPTKKRAPPNKTTKAAPKKRTRRTTKKN